MPLALLDTGASSGTTPESEGESGEEEIHVDGKSGQL